MVKASVLLLLIVSAFLGASLKEHKKALTEWAAKVVDLQRELKNAHGEIARLSAQDRIDTGKEAAADHTGAAAAFSAATAEVTALNRDLLAILNEMKRLKPATDSAHHVEYVFPFTADGRTDPPQRVTEMNTQVIALGRELLLAQQELQRIKEQSTSVIEEAAIATDPEVETARVSHRADDDRSHEARQLADAHEQVAALQRELFLVEQATQPAKEEIAAALERLAAARDQLADLQRQLILAREEIQQLKEQRAAAIEQATRQGRERSAALERELRAARKQIKRLGAENEVRMDAGQRS